jgi:Na+/melibiose symporter-like transporter
MSPAEQDKPANISDLKAPPPLPSSAPPAPPRKAYTASGFQIHMWGLTGFSYYYQYQLFAMVSLIFNLGFGMDPRLVGWALFFPRVIDSFVDPVVGHLSDITKTRWGRRRPFMFVCSVLAAFLGWTLWQANPAWPKWAQFLHLCVFVTMYFTVVMTFELTRNALSYELSDDYSIRSKIMAIASFWSVVPQVLGGAATYWFVVELAKGDIIHVGFPDFRVGWALGLAVWVGVPAVLGFLIGYVMLRTRSRQSRWIGGVLTFVVLFALPPAISYSLHGPQGTGAMFHSWNPEEEPAATSQPTSASAPASQASSQTAASSQASSASAPARQTLLDSGPETPATSRGAGIQPYVEAPAAPAATTGVSVLSYASTQASAAATSASTTLATRPNGPPKAGSTTYGLDYPGYTFFTVTIPNLGSEVAGIRFTSIIVGIIVVVFAIIPTIFIKERFQNYNEKHVSLWKAFRATLRNRAFVVTIMLRLAQTLGTVLYGNLSQYIIIYHVCHGNKSQFSAIMGYGGALLGLGFNILIWPLAAPLTKLIGKRWGLILGFGSALASAIIAPFITRPGWIWVLFLNNLFWMPWGMIQGVFFASIQPDICDVDELESGERREGLYSAVYSFINKLEISVVMLLSGYLLVWVGFDTKSAAQNIMPSDTVITHLMWWAFAPLIFFAAMAFVFTFLNPLTPKAMEKVHAELEARRAETHVVEPDKA